MRTCSRKSRKIIKNRLSISASFIAATAEANAESSPARRAPPQILRSESRDSGPQHCFPQLFPQFHPKSPPPSAFPRRRNVCQTVRVSSDRCGVEILDRRSKGTSLYGERERGGGGIPRSALGLVKYMLLMP